MKMFNLRQDTGEGEKTRFSVILESSRKKLIPVSVLNGVSAAEILGVKGGGVFPPGVAGPLTPISGSDSAAQPPKGKGGEVPTFSFGGLPSGERPSSFDWAAYGSCRMRRGRASGGPSRPLGTVRRRGLSRWLSGMASHGASSTRSSRGTRRSEVPGSAVGGGS
jgi:hypothetical protein